MDLRWPLRRLLRSLLTEDAPCSLCVAVLLGLDVADVDQRYAADPSLTGVDPITVSGALRAAVMTFLLQARRRRDCWVACWNHFVAAPP